MKNNFFTWIAENRIQIRHKRNLENMNKKTNASTTLSRDDIKKEVQLAMSSLACNVHCPKGIRGRRGRPGHRGPQANMVRLGLRGHRAQKVFREIGDLLDIRVVRALKDPRAILVNPSQPLLLCPLRCPWW